MVGGQHDEWTTVNGQSSTRSDAAMLSRGLHGGHLLLLALACLAAVLAVRAWKVMTAPPPQPPALAAPAMTDLSVLTGTDPFFPASANATAPVTTLALSLHGVRADAATGRGSAFIATSDGEQKVYTVGDKLAEGVKLMAIASDHVIIERNGIRESLWLDAGDAAAVQRFDPGATTQPAPPADSAPDSAIADSGGLPATDAPDESADEIGGSAVMAAVPAGGQ
jgi:general secretion pathway protein C